MTPIVNEIESWVHFDVMHMMLKQNSVTLLGCECTPEHKGTLVSGLIQLSFKVSLKMYTAISMAAEPVNNK